MKPLAIMFASFLTFAAGSTGYAQNYIQILSTMSAGGGSSSSSMYTSTAVIGEPAVGRHSSSDYRDGSGFFLAASGAPNSLRGQYSVSVGWNMLSVPRTVSDYRKTILFPSATTAAYSYQGLYVRNDTLRNGFGYWMKFATHGTLSLMGGARTFDTVHVSQGWNMIGSLTSPVLRGNVQPIPPVVMTSKLWGYQAGIYVQTDTVQPGAAYWVKVSNNGKIVISSSLLAQPGGAGAPEGAHHAARVELDKILSRLTFTDASGKERTLYFSSWRNDIDPLECELPPPAPTGDLDVRFSSDRMIEFPDVADGNLHKFNIRVSGAQYPLAISWNSLVQDEGAVLSFVGSQHQPTNIALKGTGSFTVTQSVVGAITLAVVPGSDTRVPAAFALYQNYPNPFNPMTNVMYDLPKDVRVTLRIYNILGEEVGVLADGLQTAGRHLLQFDASGFPTGMYFYELRAGEFHDAKKFAIVK